MTIGIIDYGAGNLQSVRNALHTLGHDPQWIRDADDLSALSAEVGRAVPGEPGQPPGAPSSLPSAVILPGEVGRAVPGEPGHPPGAPSSLPSVLILPGQGEFGDSARNLQSRGLWEPLRDWIDAGRPYFGICLGYQILFDSGEEAPGTPGLGIFKGTVKKFPSDRGLKIPHMGWNEITFTDPGDPLWRGLPGSTLERPALSPRSRGEAASGSSPDASGLAHAYFVHSYYPAPAAPEAIAACTTDYGGLSFVSAIRRGALFACQFHPEKSQAVGLAILKNYFAALRA